MNTVTIHLDERITLNQFIRALAAFGMRAVYDGDQRGLVVTVAEHAPVKSSVVNLCERRVAREALKT